jgi:riboflavin kinase/FMN adenylyltransferase
MSNHFAATVGFFDGVHTGHRFLIEELKREAALHGLKTMLITFSTHPRKVLNVDFQPLLLTSYQEKINLLSNTGVDLVEVLEFSKDMAQLTAREFIHDILYKQYNVHLLLAGHDHRFGKNREDGFADYQTYGRQTGMEVMLAGRYSTHTHDHISSSTIRKFIQEGRIEEANALLGYPYSFSGLVVTGYQVGRKIGFPTANLKVEPAEKLIPGTGVYAVTVEFNQRIYTAMMNIGYRPTIDNNQQLSIEVHIVDFNEDIYHQQLNVHFLFKIRDEIRFATLDQLIAQLENDKALILERLQ